MPGAKLEMVPSLSLMLTSTLEKGGVAQPDNRKLKLRHINWIHVPWPANSQTGDGVPSMRKAADISSTSCHLSKGTWDVLLCNKSTPESLRLLEGAEILRVTTSSSLLNQISLKLLCLEPNSWSSLTNLVSAPSLQRHHHHSIHKSRAHSWGHILFTF